MQGIIWIWLAVLLTGEESSHFLSLFLALYGHSLLSLSSCKCTTATIWYFKKQKGMLFSCGEIHVFNGNRFQWALWVLLCQAVMLLYVWWHSILTKATLGGSLCMSTRESTDLCVAWASWHFGLSIVAVLSPGDITHVETRSLEDIWDYGTYF